MPYRKLGRPANHRRSMLRNLVTALLASGRIETTETRAKTVQPIAEKMISLGKRGDLHARRRALAYIWDESVVTKVFEELAPRYADRPGGYTRIIKTSIRQGDGASMAILELVE
ncbi:MAG: 50S ribosomal protein L17 [Firmicutes bacterium]|nr:50S ribosomal protein L17 [Bacillota bacterium]